MMSSRLLFSTRSLVNSQVARSFSTTSTLSIRLIPQEVASKIPKTPAPTKNVPDVETFLTKIGRNAIETSDNFESWEQLMTMTGFEMKQKGIDTRLRRYILGWRERFRVGGEDIELKEHKRGKKSWGGERRRKAVRAEFYAKEYRKMHKERLEAESAAAKK